MIVARQLTASLGGRRIVGPLDFTLQDGRFIVLLGPNGAGKTTLLRALAGLLPFEGALTLGGVPLDALARRARARRIAYLPQGHQAYWPLKAREIVALGRLPHGLGDPAIPAPADARIIARALARMDVSHLAERPVTTLSGGERARVMMARVLAVEAPVLLADEPTAALDPRHQIGVMEALRDEARAGKLVVAVTHDLTLAARMADEVILLDEGQMAAQGAPREALTDAVLHQVYGIKVQRGEIEGAPWLLPWQA